MKRDYFLCSNKWKTIHSQKKKLYIFFLHIKIRILKSFYLLRLSVSRRVFSSFWANSQSKQQGKVRVSEWVSEYGVFIICSIGSMSEFTSTSSGHCFLLFSFGIIFRCTVMTLLFGSTQIASIQFNVWKGWFFTPLFIWGFGFQMFLQLFVYINYGISLLPFFQANFSQDVSKVQRSHVVCCGTKSPIGYGKTLASRSHNALRFSVTQQSVARSIRYRRMTCVNAADSVSFSFKICGLGICLQNNTKPMWNTGEVKG